MGNQINYKQLNFSHSLLSTILLTEGTRYYLDKPSIVVNFHPTDLILNDGNCSIINAFSSKSLCDKTIKPQKNCLVFEVNLSDQLPTISWPNQEKYIGKKNITSVISDYPFFRSPSDVIEILYFNPLVLAASCDRDYGEQTFQLKANLWFAEAGTHCGIHNKHPFIEIHTQIFGDGKMQLFEKQGLDLKKEIQLKPGDTTSKAFCRVTEANNYIYPYHQYYADTDSIWLVLEYTPIHIS